MVNCWIFDDQYGGKIYEKFKTLLPEYNYPIKNDTETPIPFIDKIENGDIILLDNYFPGETWEEPFGNDFLQLYIEKGLNCKIICISDYGKVLLDRYINRDLVNQKGDIIGWVTSKDSDEIVKILKADS